LVEEAEVGKIYVGKVQKNYGFWRLC